MAGGIFINAAIDRGSALIYDVQSKQKIPVSTYKIHYQEVKSVTTSFQR
jgi:hypothetical protein